jgi:hypothetical protein
MKILNILIILMFLRIQTDEASVSGEWRSYLCSFGLLLMGVLAAIGAGVEVKYGYQTGVAKTD